MAERTDENPRLADLRDFCERHGWELEVEPMATEHQVWIDLDAYTRLTVESRDSVEVALARMEKAVMALANTRSDVYLHEPHRDWGRV